MRPGTPFSPVGMGEGGFFRAYSPGEGEKTVSLFTMAEHSFPISDRRRTVRRVLPAVLIAPFVLFAGCGQGGSGREVSSGGADGGATGRPGFVGRQACIPCHRDEYDAWLGSDHDRSMQVVSDSTVLGDFDNAEFEDDGEKAVFYRRDGGFFVRTDGADGQPADFEILYTFGFEPLQQYLVPFPDGRVQALTIAWNSVKGEWFSLYPDRRIEPGEWLHWTGGAETWNGMCAECHSTNLVKRFDGTSRTFSTTWSEIDVSCEACHGPGSEHVKWAEGTEGGRPEVDGVGFARRTGGGTAREEVEMCAPCHSRRIEMGDYRHGEGEWFGNLVPSLLEEGLYFADGQILDEVYVYGSFVQSAMYREGVRCGDCHDVHSTKRLRPGNALCTECHDRSVFDTAGHHHHEAGAVECTGCHMPERPYMIIDNRGDHSFRSPRPDLTVEYGFPNSCTAASCHDDKSDAWAAGRFAKWYGVDHPGGFGPLLQAGREGKKESLEGLVDLAGDRNAPAIVRGTALSLLGAWPNGEAARAFESARADTEPFVRYAAAQYADLSWFDDPAAYLAPLLADRAQGVRTQAAARLATLGEPPGDSVDPELFDRAIGEYIAAMERSLDFSFAGFNLGNVYAALGRKGEAMEEYRASIAADPNDSPARMNLAILLYGEGRAAEAESLFREILARRPNHLEATYSLALLLAGEEHFDEAAGLLGRAATLMPDHPRVWYNLGLTLRRAGRPGEAESALVRAAALDSTDIDILNALAVHYLEKGRLEEARRLAKRMTLLRPDLPAGRRLIEKAEEIENAGRRDAPAGR